MCKEGLKAEGTMGCPISPFTVNITVFSGIVWGSNTSKKEYDPGPWLSMFLRMPLSTSYTWSQFRFWGKVWPFRAVSTQSTQLRTQHTCLVLTLGLAEFPPLRVHWKFHICGIFKHSLEWQRANTLQYISVLMFPLSLRISFTKHKLEDRILRIPRQWWLHWLLLQNRHCFHVEMVVFSKALDGIER